MNGSPENYRLERVEEAKGRLFAYRYCGDDTTVPDHRLCAPCWNAETLTVVLHEYSEGNGRAQLQCPTCNWHAKLERPANHR